MFKLNINYHSLKPINFITVFYYSMNSVRFINGFYIRVLLTVFQDICFEPSSNNYKHNKNVQSLFKTKSFSYFRQSYN